MGEFNYLKSLSGSNNERILNGLIKQIREFTGIKSLNYTIAKRKLLKLAKERKIQELDTIGDRLINNYVDALVEFYFKENPSSEKFAMKADLRSNRFLSKIYFTSGLNKIFKKEFFVNEMKERRAKLEGSIVEFLVGFIIETSGIDAAVEFLSRKIYTEENIKFMRI